MAWPATSCEVGLSVNQNMEGIPNLQCNLISAEPLAVEASAPNSVWVLKPTKIMVVDSSDAKLIWFSGCLEMEVLLQMLRVVFTCDYDRNTKHAQRNTQWNSRNHQPKMPMTSAMCVHAPSVCKAASSSRHLPHLPTQAAKLPVPPCHHTITSRFFCWQVEDERSAVLERLKVRVTVSLWKSKVKVVKQFLSEATGKTRHTKAVCEALLFLCPINFSWELSV